MADSRTLKFLLFGEDRSATKAIKGVGKEAEKTGGILNEIKSGAAKLGGALVAAFAVDRIVDFSKQAIDSYSQLEDSTAAASTIFGKNMGDIEKQAKTAAKSMGMSKSQVMDAANTFGVFGKSAGLSGKDLSGFSTKMTALAGDMASFRGTSPQEAIEAIGAAFRGETEPIRKYGVMLDDATMRDEALRMGLVKTTKQALTPQQKVLVAQSLILKKTKDAQGDYARTADSTANKMKSAQARYEDLSAAIGEKLAPVLVKLIDMGNKVLDWLDANPDATEGATAAFEGLVGMVEFLAQVFGFVLGPTLSNTSRAMAWLMEQAANMLDQLGNAPGFEWAKGAAVNLHKMAKGAEAVANGIDQIGKTPPKVETNLAQENLTKLKTKMDSIKSKIVEAKAKGDTREVDRLRTALDKLKKQYDIKLNVRKTGIKAITVAGSGNTRIAISAYAGGGRPRVGELAMFHRDELWVPDTAGTVLTAAQSRRALGGPQALSGGGPTVNVYVQGDTDPDGAARRIVEQIRTFFRRNGKEPPL